MKQTKKYDIFSAVCEELDGIKANKAEAKLAGEKYEDSTTFTPFEGWPFMIAKDPALKFRIAVCNEACIPETFETREEALIFMRDNIDYVMMWGAITMAHFIAKNTMTKNAKK